MQHCLKPEPALQRQMWTELALCSTQIPLTPRHALAANPRLRLCQRRRRRMSALMLCLIHMRARSSLLHPVLLRLRSGQTQLHQYTLLLLR